MKKLIILFTMILGCMFPLDASEKMYIDENELSMKGDAFHIHIGHNIWLVTNSVHRDCTGLYAFKRNLVSDMHMEYEKKWRCPYCYHYWPLGTACQNRDCPSKYK